MPQKKPPNMTNMMMNMKTKVLEQPAEPAVACSLCSRLVKYREETRVKHPTWFNGAVPSFTDIRGNKHVELLIVGLAPGMQGANRTGRPFTGDWAGDLLFATLLKFGFAKGEYISDGCDDLTLNRTMITNAVRCVPPQNKPIGAEMKNCRPFLAARIRTLPALKVIICLGRIAHDNTLSALEIRRASVPFGHNQASTLETADRKITLIDSYHCSRYNTNTGRLTVKMFEQVFEKAQSII